MNKNNEILTIKQFMHTRTSIIELAAKNNKINTVNCSKEQFKSLMQTLKFPEKYYRDILMDTLYNTYLNQDGKTMNMTKLCEDCINMKDENNFSEFKERVFDYFENKIENQIKEVDETVEDLKNEKEARLNLVNDLRKQIEEKKEIEKNCKKKKKIMKKKW